MAQGRDQIIVDVLGNTKPLEKNIGRVANQALTLNTKNFSQPLGKITGQLGEFEKSLAASNARVIAFGASAGAIYAVQRAFEATVRTVIDVEKSLADINVILNVSQKSLANFGNRLFDIAKNTGLSFSDVAKAATEFSRQGLGIEDTLKRTSDALILTRLSGLDTVSSVEALTAAINSFSNSALTSTEIVNKLAAVDAAFAVSSADLAEAIKRVGSSADDVGVSFDQLIGLVTSAQQITSRGGSVIGNSFKTIFTRLQRPKTLEALEEIGVATRDQEGNILPLLQILNSLAQSYEKLGSVQKAQIAETVGGVFQINILKAALGDLSKEYSIYSRALGISSGATDEATRRNEILNQTLSATINKTLANLQNAATDIGNLALAPALERALGGLNYALENFGTDESEGIGGKIGEGLARGLGNFLSGPGLLIGIAGLIKIFERLTVFTADAFKQLTGLNTQTAEQRALQAQVLNLIGRNPQIIQQINSGNLDTANLHKQILSLIEQETIAMQRQVTVADSLTKSLMAAGVRVAQTGPMKGAATVKTKSSGFIPNFSADQEIMGAFAGGYMPGQIKKMVIPNYGGVTYNSAEKVKRFNGMTQPAIMPPQESLAGKNYKKNFEAVHGFNPYANKGFIPNFATLLGNPYEQNYVKLQGELKNIASAGAAEVSISRIGKALGVVKGPEGNFYVPFNNYEKLIKASKQDLEKNAAARGTKFEGKIEPYALVYPSFGMSNAFPSAGKAGGKSIGFDIVPFPGKIKGQSTNIIGTGLYKKSLKALVDNASEFLVNLAGVDPDVIDDQKFKNYLYSNISQDQIGSLVGNAFEGGILAALNIVPDDRSRILDLNKEEIKKLGETFKISPLMSGKYLGGDFKNALSPYNLDSMAGKILNTKLNKNFGFIPNFSPIEKAFKTERGLGGNPVLDYQSGVGLYVRDSKRQPNFAAVKRDHPEGLSKAISNSYAMQKGMAALGFIPNFVQLPETIPTSQADMLKATILRGRSTQDSGMQELTQEQKKLTETTKKTIFDLEKFREKAIFASFGFSLAGSFFSEIAGDNEGLKKDINSFSQGLSTSLTALSLLPPGIGTAVAGATALYSAAVFVAKRLRSGGESISTNFEKIKEETSNFSNATSVYSQNLQKLNDAYANTKTPVETIIKLNQDLAKSAMDLPAKYRLQLLSITDNIKLQEEINRIQAGLAREQRSLEFATSINAKLQEGGIFTPDVFKTLGQTRAGAKETFAGFSEQGQVKFLRDLNDEIFKLNQPDLINFLQKFYGLNQDLADVLSRLNEKDFEEVTTALSLYARGLKEAREEFKATENLRNEQMKTQKKLEKDTLKAKEAVDRLSNSLTLLINNSIRSETFRQNLGNVRGSNARDVQISRAGGLIELFEQYSSEASVSSFKNRIAELKAIQEIQTQAREITSSTRESILGIGAGLLEDLRRPGQDQPQSESVIKAFEDRLLDISKQNINANETAKQLNEAVSSILGASFDKSIEIQSNIENELRLQNQKLTTLKDEQKKNSDIAKAGVIIQQKMLESRQNLAVAGGAQDFLAGPGGFNERYSKFQELAENYRANFLLQRGTFTFPYTSEEPRGAFRNGQPIQRKEILSQYNANTSGRYIARGRAALGLLSEAQNFVGGGIDIKKFGGIAPLRQEAIKGRALDIQTQARAFQAMAPSGLKSVYGDIAARSTEIATQQIDALLKTQDIGLNVAELVRLVTSIDQSQKSILDPLSNLPKGDNGLTIDIVRGSLEKASKIFSARETYQNIGQEISTATLKRDLGERQIVTSQEQISKLTPGLEDALKKALLETNGADSPANFERIQNIANVLKGAAAEGRIITKRDLGIEGQVRSDSKFNLLLEEYNKQASVLANARASSAAASKALEELNSKAFEAASTLVKLGEFNITPIGNLGKPQTVQGSVDLILPEDQLQMNVGGNISLNMNQVEVVLSPNSDLTTLVTPIVQDFLNQSKIEMENKFNNEIFKIREEAGLRRQPGPLPFGGF